MAGDHEIRSFVNEFGIAMSDDELSRLLTENHEAYHQKKAAILTAGLLYPNQKPGDKPELTHKGGGNWVLNWKTVVAASGRKGVLGVGLTLFGATTAE